MKKEEFCKNVIPLLFMLTLRKKNTVFTYHLIHQYSTAKKKKSSNLPYNNLSFYSRIEKQHFRQGFSV